MTDANGAESELERFRKAVHDLYLVSLTDDQRDRLREAGYLPPDILPIGEIGQMFAELDNVHRWFKLHAVASTLNRRPQLRSDRSSLVGLAPAIESGDPDRDREMPDLLHRFAELAEQQPTGLTPRRWALFLETIKEPDPQTHTPETANPGPALRYLVNKPGCNDEEIVPTPTGRATSIRSRFWTKSPLAVVSRFIDPSHWPICGRPFWKQMAVVTGTKSEFTRPRSKGYTAVFQEKVDLPAIREVTANLRMLFEHSDDHVSLDYRLAGKVYPNTQVSFDSGWICATTVTTGPHAEKTYVESLKVIRFVSPVFNELPDLACDGGWVNFMINMALDCDGLPPGPYPLREEVENPAAVQPPSGAVSGVGEAVDDWVAVAAKSLHDHGKSTKSAIDRALAPHHDPHWVNDLVSMGRGAVKTTQATLSAWRRILSELAKRGGER